MSRPVRHRPHRDTPNFKATCGNFLRRWALPQSVPQELSKIGAKVVHHARCLKSPTLTKASCPSGVEIAALVNEHSNQHKTI